MNDEQENLDNVNDTNTSGLDKEQREQRQQNKSKLRKDAEKKAKKHVKNATRKARRKASAALFKPVGVTIFSSIFAIFIIIFMIIGIISFITTMPGMVQEQIMNKVLGVVDGLGYLVNGPDYYLEQLAKDTSKTAQKKVLKYLDDMGLDPAGLGFAAFYECSEDGNVEYTIKQNETTVSDKNYTLNSVIRNKVNDSVSGVPIIGNVTDFLVQFANTLDENHESVRRTIEDDLIFKYIISNERTYLVDDRSKKVFSGIADIFGGKENDFTGMIKIGQWFDGYDISVDRKNKKLTLTTKNWSELSKQAMTYNMDGYLGRYGMPLEFLLAIHIGTMTSDLTEEMITNPNLQTQVIIETEKNDYDMEYKVTYKGKELNEFTGKLSDMSKLEGYATGSYIKKDKDGKWGIELTDSQINKIKKKLNIFSLYGFIEKLESFNFSDWTAASDISNITHQAEYALLGEDEFRVINKMVTPEYSSEVGLWTSFFGYTNEDMPEILVEDEEDQSDTFKTEVSENNGIKIYKYYYDFAVGVKDSETLPLEDENVNEFHGYDESSLTQGEYEYNYNVGYLHGIEYYLQQEHTSEFKNENTRKAMMCILSQIDAYLYANNLSDMDSNVKFTKYKYYNRSNEFDNEDDSAIEKNFGVRRGEFSIDLNSTNSKDRGYRLLLTQKFLDFCDSHNGLENASDDEIREFLESLSKDITDYMDKVDGSGDQGLTEDEAQDVVDDLLTKIGSELAGDLKIPTVRLIFNTLKDKSSEMEKVTPRITKVLRHWYKDIIFEYEPKTGEYTEEWPIEIEGEGSDGIEVTAVLTSKKGNTSYTQKGSPYVVKGDVVTLDGEVVEDEDNSGTTYFDTTNGTYKIGDGYRTTKKLFTQGKYYTYDGSKETAQSIGYAKLMEQGYRGSDSYGIVAVKNGKIMRFNLRTGDEIKEKFGEGMYNFVSGNIDDSTDGKEIIQGDGWTVILIAYDENKSEYIIKFNDSLEYKSPAEYDVSETNKSVERINSLLTALGVVTQRKPVSFDNTTAGGDIVTLTAFSILEGMHSEDAELIYRDFKEFLIELGYYTKAEFEQIETKVLTWFIPEYVPENMQDKINWRQNKEEDALLYGALIYPKQTDENGEVTQEGFEPDLDVVAPGNCRIIEVVGATDGEPAKITLQFDGMSQPEIGILDGYTMIIKGINISDVMTVYSEDNDDGIETDLQTIIDQGLIVKAGSVIGSTGKTKIQVVMKNQNGGLIDDVEDYMGPYITTSYEYNGEGSVLDQIKALKGSTENFKDAGSYVNDSKYQTVYSLYWDTIVKYSNKYGTDPYLVLAFICRECPGNGTLDDILQHNGKDGGYGLGQFQWDANIGFGSNYVVGFADGTKEEFNLGTKNEFLRNTDLQIHLATAMFKAKTESFGGNILAALQAYNYGDVGLKTVTEKLTGSMSLGEFYEYMKNDISNEWMKYRKQYPPGDPMYVENVLKYYNIDR